MLDHIIEAATAKNWELHNDMGNIKASFVKKNRKAIVRINNQNITVDIYKTGKAATELIATNKGKLGDKYEDLFKTK